MILAVIGLVILIYAVSFLIDLYNGRDTEDSSDEAQTSLIKGPIKGYKAFDCNFRCKGFQFEVGQTYELPPDRELKLGESGYHFCQIPYDCNRYYFLTHKPRHAEILAWDFLHEGDKSVARKIEIVQELSLEAWQSLTGRFEASHMTLYLENGQRHREDGPALEKINGDKIWYSRGMIYRDDGPAMELANGNRYWYNEGKLWFSETGNGDKEWYTEVQCRDRVDPFRIYYEPRLHRLNGPAIERANGDKEWYLYGKLHRADGPAVIKADGEMKWYQHGKHHRVDGPAIIKADGEMKWYQYGQLIGTVEANKDQLGYMNDQVHRDEDEPMIEQVNKDRLAVEKANRDKLRYQPEPEAPIEYVDPSPLIRRKESQSHKPNKDLIKVCKESYF